MTILYIVTLDHHTYIEDPRHPVIPPEVNGVLGIFLGVQSYRTSAGGPGCLGVRKECV